MRTQKFTHKRGAIAIAITCITLILVIIGLIGLLIIEVRIDFLSAIFIIVPTIAIIWSFTKLYKPLFTNIIFSNDEIVAKTLFDKITLPVNEIKGIWYYKKHADEIIPYSEKDSLKRSVIIIGDIECFTNVKFLEINAAKSITDTFKEGYVAIEYRKELDEVLEYYNHQIRNNS